MLHDTTRCNNAATDEGVVVVLHSSSSEDAIQYNTEWCTTGGTTVRHGVIRGLVEAGNCVFCGKHIDGGGHVFLCEECRRKDEEGCPHGKQKEEAIAMARPERPTTVKEPRQKPTGREEQ